MSDLRNVSLKQLRAFVATVRTGTVTAAARELHVTPPAIAIQLKNLEDSVGAPLFDRASGAFVPTELGRELLAAAREVDRIMVRTGERMAALRSGATGSIVFGAVSTAKYFAPAMVAAFQGAHPEIRVKLVIGNRGDIVDGLDRGEYDLLVMGRPPEHLPLASETLGEHPHVLIAAPGHPLAGRSDIEAESLLRERFLAREPGSGTRLLMNRLLERIGRGRVFDIVEMGTNETIKQAVMAGLGIAVISAHTCLVELQAGRLVTLGVEGLPVVRQWFLIHRADRPLAKAAEIMRGFLVANRDRLMPGPI